MRIIKNGLIILYISVFISYVFSIKNEFEYMGLKLGMTEEEVRKVVSQNKDLKIDNRRYLGEINQEVPSIIRIYYYPYIDNIYVQMYKNYVFNITIEFNERYFDYYSLIEAIENKYGMQQKVRTSKLNEWRIITNNRETVIRVEYPSTVKAIDYNKMIEINSIITQNTFIKTNTTVDASNRARLLKEF